MDESGWKWMKVIEMDENRWKIMELNWISRCYTSISDGLVDTRLLEEFLNISRRFPEDFSKISRRFLEGFSKISRRVLVDFSKISGKFREILGKFWENFLVKRSYLISLHLCFPKI